MYYAKADYLDNDRMRERKRFHEEWRRKCREKTRLRHELYKTDRDAWKKEFSCETDLKKAERLEKRKAEILGKLHT